MTYHNLKFEFMGFDPKYEVRNFISSVAEGIHALAPSDSVMRVVIEKSKEAIRASCQIASQAGVFAAEAMSDCPKKAIRQIESKIKRQLDEWKKYRFAVSSNSERSPHLGLAV